MRRSTTQPPRYRTGLRLALAALALAAACGPATEPAPPVPRADVLLVTLDTVRADRLGAYGHAAARTPVFDALARRGLVFDAARTPAPITLPAHASMLAGVHPRVHGVRENAIYRVADGTRLVSEAVREAGWRTGAFVGSFVIGPATGLDQGFEAYDGPSASTLGSAGDSRRERPAGEVVDAALGWLADLPPDEPWFAWVHFYDPHTPYAAPEPFASELPDAYDAEIAYADAQLGRLLDGIAALGRPDAPWIVVASDHGESLGEHGEEGHGIFVYDATMHVPLLVVAPGAVEGDGRRVDAPVSLVDVGPTLREVFGLPRDALPDARTPSLLATARAVADRATDPAAGPDPGDRPVALESWLPYHKHRWHPLQGLVWRGYKYVESPRPELFHLESDPGEQVNLVQAEPERLSALRGRLRLWLDERPPADARRATPSVEDRQRLAALGYTGTAGAEDLVTRDLPAPAERIGDLALEKEARRLLARAWRLLGARASGELGAAPGGAADTEVPAEIAALLDRARELLGELRARHGADPTPVAELGFLEYAAGNLGAAAAAFEEHALLAPRTATTRYYLAECYRGLGRAREARAEMAKVVALDDQADAAYTWLADDLAAAGLHGRAVWWLQRLEAVWRATPEDHARLDARLARATTDMRDAGQQPLPSPHMPPRDMRPEGVLADG